MNTNTPSVLVNDELIDVLTGKVDGPKVIIHKSVLHRLIYKLPREAFDEMQKRIVTTIGYTNTHEELIDTLREELEWQLSVNKIIEYTAKPEMGKIVN